MSDPLVSVLMVNYNHEKTIKRTIESVLNQTYKNIQFIIVDDGSKDGSIEVIKSFKDPRIELFELHDNNHICLATNFGFKKVKGDYLARIDSDDIWYPEKLKKQLQFINNNKDCNICFTWSDWIDEDGNLINDSMSDLMDLTDVTYSTQQEWLNTFYYIGNCLLHSSVLMKRCIMEETGDFTIGYRQLHDFDYWIRIAKKHNLYVIPERLIAMCRFRESNVNASSITEKNDIRTFNEFMDIRENFFNNIDDKVLIDSFSHDFINKNSVSKKELECEKAFLLCHPQVSWPNHIPLAGIKKLKNLLEEEQYRILLQEKFDFTIHDFYEMMTHHLYEDERLVDERQKYILENNNLYLEKKELEGKLSNVLSSSSWKITAPIRFIVAHLRKSKNCHRYD